MTLTATTPDPAGYFAFNDKTKRYVFAFNTIIWLQATRIYTIIHVKERHFVVCSQNIGDIERQFANAGFYRIHRSHMVNLNEVVKYEDRKVLLSDDTELFVAHRAVTDFLKAYCETKHLPLRRRSRSPRRVG